MARRKKIEPIVSLGDNDKLTVQKSQPLFVLWHSDLTLAEFKILDTYLARINSHEPDKRQVTFEKGEIEQCLGVSKINLPDLKQRLYHLMGNVVELPDNTLKKGFRAITLFEEAIAEQDDYGVWNVKLECTQKAMKYFFDIDNIGYLRYKLRSIASLTSRYTYIMFIYLEHNRFRKSWEVELAELKKILACDDEETYREYKHFNNLVLKKVQKEMDEKTECRYSYEPIKRGRNVTAIKFTLETLQDTEQLSMFDIDDVVPVEQDAAEIELGAAADDRELWQKSLDSLNVKLTSVEYDEVFSLLATVPTYKLPVMQGGIGIRRYHYLDILVTKINSRAKKEYIRNKYAYLLGIIRNDVKND